MTAPTPHLSARRPAAVLAGWLVDGGGGAVRERVRLCLNNGRIAAVDDGAPGDGTADGVLDLSTCTLVPGLVDCHVHLILSGTSDRRRRERQLAAGFAEARPVIAGHLALHRGCGVVAVRDGGDRNALALRYKQRCGEEARCGPCLRVAGRAWHARGRYGRLIGRAPLPGQRLPDALADSVDGVDHVKIVNSGLNSLLEFGRRTPPQFSIDELRAVVDTAGRAGLRVMVHANGAEPVGMAVAAGCHSVEHGFFMGRENLARMADAGTTWVPTAVTMKAYADRTTPGDRALDVCRRNLDHQLDQMRAARELGVRVAVGTDAGSPGVHHGRAVREEMALLADAGYSVAEIVQAATGRGAELLGLAGAGVLARGRWATFVAVKGPPDNLPAGLEHPAAICVRGVVEGP